MSPFRVGQAVLVASLFAMPSHSKVDTQAASPSDLLSSGSQLRQAIDTYGADLGSLTRFYSVRTSEARSKRLGAFYRNWRKALDGIDFDKLSHESQIDWILFQNHLERELRDLERDQKQFKEVEGLLPFAWQIAGLEESRRRMAPLDPEKAATTLNDLKKSLDKCRQDLEKSLDKQPYRKSQANRAARMTNDLKQTLAGWFKFYGGYMPLFSWWCAEPYKALDKDLQDYFNFLKEKLVGIKPDDETAIVGDPIGREALLAELKAEMIPYTPEKLVNIAEQEFAWCDKEMLKASKELGCGDDWKRALEHVKEQHVGPGEQPKLVRDLALEAIDFIEKRNLVTVPELAKETWRMEMMTPERQLQNPFFLGGEQITVSFPTDTMSQDQKIMSLRANNIHFARATVFHELFPGHALQQFMTARFSTQRGMFGTPFWIEGWALYWEMLLWDLGFPKTPENRIGMLFWRMHRCARIIFSLNFHLEKWNPEQCIQFLIDRVGHEPDSAAGEVRRSFAGSYGPLYQAAYMLGGLQFRALHKELVESGKMTGREFHDTILKSGDMPVAMVRAELLHSKLTKDYKADWRFAGSP